MPQRDDRCSVFLRQNFCRFAFSLFPYIYCLSVYDLKRIVWFGMEGLSLYFSIKGGIDIINFF